MRGSGGASWCNVSPPLRAPVVYLVDRFLAPDEPARVSLFDRGYLLGDSVFASLRVYAGWPFALDRHVSRFTAAAHALGLACPGAGELEALARAACARFVGESAYLRLTLSRGEGGPGLALGGATAPVLSVVVRELASAPFPEPTPAAEVSLRAPPAACQDPAWTLGSYAARVAMRREAEARGHREGFGLALDGELVSGITSNVFVVRGATVMTPRLASGCRPGVTRERLLALLGEAGIPVQERRLTLAELRSADGAFFTSALTPVLPVGAFEGRPWGGSSPLIAQARALYEAAVARERGS